MSGAALEPLLERVRTRAGLAAVATTAVPAAVATWGAAELAHFTFTAPLAVAAAFVSAAMAWRRRPALDDIARDVDRHLRLQSSLITAWQFRASTDAFAARTRTRALEGLRQLRPAAVYPLRLSRTGIACLALGIAMTVGATVASRRRVDEPPSTRVSNAIALPGQARPATQDGTPARRPDSAADSVVPAPQPAPPSAPATPPVDPSRPPDDAAAPRSSSPSAEQPAGALTSTEAASTGRTAPGGGTPSGAGTAASGRATARAGNASASVPAPGSVHAQGLERVPMNRRAYVRRYLLSRAETR